MPNNTTPAPSSGPNSTVHTTVPPSGSHQGGASHTGVVLGVVFGLLGVGILVTALLYIRRKNPRSGWGRKGMMSSSLGTALLSAGDRGGPLAHNDEDDSGLHDDDDAILLFDKTFDDHKKYPDSDTISDRVVFDKYVGDTVVFEGGPEADGVRTAMAQESGEQRPTSSELARAKCIILESSRLEMQRELENTEREKEALRQQIEAERMEKQKISGVNGALARQNLKLKTEFHKLKKEFESREDEIQNLEVNLDEHLLMKVPTVPTVGSRPMPAAIPFTDFYKVGDTDDQTTTSTVNNDSLYTV